MADLEVKKDIMEVKLKVTTKNVYLILFSRLTVAHWDFEEFLTVGLFKYQEEYFKNQYKIAVFNFLYPWTELFRIRSHHRF